MPDVTTRISVISGPYIAKEHGGGGRQLPQPEKLNIFVFSNIVFDFAALILVAILVRNL